MVAKVSWVSGWLTGRDSLHDVQVKAENRVNRATIALFKFENGAVGSLNHTLLMHGSNFYTELDIFGDGFAIAIRDPYQNPAVFVRRPHSDDLVEVSRHWRDAYGGYVFVS